MGDGLAIKQKIGDQSLPSLTREFFYNRDVLAYKEYRNLKLRHKYPKAEDWKSSKQLISEYYENKDLVRDYRENYWYELAAPPAYATLSDLRGYTDIHNQLVYDISHIPYTEKHNKNIKGVDLKSVKPEGDNEMIAHDTWEHGFGQAILNRAKIEFSQFNLGNGFTPNGECFIQGFEGVIEIDYFIDTEERVKTGWIDGLEFIFKNYFGRNQIITMGNVKEVIESLLLGHYTAISLKNNFTVIDDFTTGKRAVKKAITNGMYTDKYGSINYSASFLPIPELEHLHYSAIEKQVKEVSEKIMKQPEFVEMLSTLKNLKK